MAQRFLLRISPKCASLAALGTAILVSLGLPAQAQLVVSEIMYHPPAVSADDTDDAAEFLELFNAGMTPVDLSGYQFDRGVRYLFPAGTTLGSKEYLVLAKNPPLHGNLGPNTRLLGPFEGSLSNAGERLRMRDASGRDVIDFRYGTLGDWPAAPDGTGHSLIFPDPTLDPACGRDWRASEKRMGSPGESGQSLIPPDQTQRSLIRKGTVGRYFKGRQEPSEGTLAWTEPDFEPDRTWLTGPSGYGYSNNATERAPISTVLSDMRGNYLSVYVRLPFEIQQDELNRLDSLMLTMHYDDSYVIYLNGTRVAAAGVNGSPPAFDQTSIEGADYAPHRIDLSARANLLRPGQNILAIQGHNVGINNSSDFVLGPELDLTVAPELSQDEAIRNLRINEIRANHPTEPDFVEFYNPTDTAIDLSNTWLSDEADELNRFQFPPESIVEPMGFLSVPLSLDTHGFALGIRGDRLYLSSPELDYVAVAYAFGSQIPGRHIGRFPDGSRNWYYSTTPTPGTANVRNVSPQIALSELNYHDPLTESQEYIELRNLGESAVDVTGWEMNGVGFQFPQSLMLLPGQVYLIADDPEAVGQAYSVPSNQIIGRYTGSLSNRGERISILDGNDIVIDSVRYQDEFPWPITADGLGASLERRCFESPFDTPSAWSASPLNRPSPGLRNNVESCEPTGATAIQISELHYHPAVRDSDDRAFEFLELTNRSGGAVDLTDWIVAGDIFYLFPPDSQLASGASLILSWDPQFAATHYGLDTSQVFGPYQGELPNGGGEVLLVRPDGQLVERLRYNDDFPWPSLADGGTETAEIALQRRCFDASSDGPANWEATAPPTPGQHTGETAACQEPTHLIATATEPALVTASTRPLITARFSGSAPDSVRIRYWIDDPEISEGEPVAEAAMNDQGADGDQVAGDGLWSATLPNGPVNAVIRYQILHQSGGESGESPAADRDAFSWHAYFVDPESDSNLPNNYHLFVSSANWRRLHQATQPGRVSGSRANPRWNEEVPAVFVAEGVVHDVMVRHQGSRWNRNNGSTVRFDCESHRSDGMAQVRSWRIDFPSHRNHNGMDVILLQKQSGWPQHISFKMFELAGVPAPRTSWAKLRINGCDYNSDAFQIERPGRDLVARWFDEVGDLFKSQGFTGNEGPWSWGDARLIRGSRNGSTEQERYEHTYNRKTLSWKNNPFDGIEDAPEALIEGLHSARRDGPAALRTYLAEQFDVDRTLRYICTINYVGTFDDMFQNHYLYRKAEDGKWCMFPWDMDNTLGGSFGQSNANPFRGVDESRHGNVGNRQGWWNRIKDSFFIAYEAEFLAMFHHLNNTVHSPSALLPYLQEGAQIRGLGQSSVTNLANHMQRRHDYLNGFIAPLLPPPRLTIVQTEDTVIVAWPAGRSDYRLETAPALDDAWTRVPSPPENRLVIPLSQSQGFYRLMPSN